MLARALVLHEPPLSLDGTHVPDPPDVQDRIAACLQRSDASGATDLFLAAVGVPWFGRRMMRLIPGVWSGMTSAATTLPYDFAILGDTQRGGPLPEELDRALASIDVPTWVLIGGKRPAYMRHAVERVAATIGGAQARELGGQQHNVSPKAVAPVLREIAAGLA